MVSGVAGLSVVTPVHVDPIDAVCAGPADPVEIPKDEADVAAVVVILGE